MSAPLELESIEIQLGPSRRIGPLSFTAEPGNIVVITGGAGSGKSMLLDVVTGFRTPTAGYVTVDGHAPRFGEAGILTQRHELLGALTAVENVAVRAHSIRERTRGVRRRSPRSDGLLAGVEPLLASLGLPPASWHNLVEQLSGGQQQRVALARALVGAPTLVVLDDPTSELDEATADIVWSAIEHAAAIGAIVIVTTDEVRLIERATAVVTLLDNPAHEKYRAPRFGYP